MLPPVTLIAVTGGPCGGKSTAMESFVTLLKKRGIRVVVLPEAVTELVGNGILPSSPGFQTFLLRYILQREDTEIAEAKRLGVPTVIIEDRGALDAKAYMSKDEWRTLLSRMRLSEAELMARYALVIHLVTAADGAESFYTLSNNAARTETPEKARELDARTQFAWLAHPHHFIVDNSTPFAEKISRAVNHFTRVLHMPVAKEHERKFVISNFCRERLPDDTVEIHIVQHYLMTLPGEPEHRVRKSVVNGETTYYQTKKGATADPRSRDEEEEVISHQKYTQLLRKADPNRKPIEKTRHSFVFSGKRLELDFFTSGGLKGLAMLEIELGHRDEDIVIPPFLSAHEVTDNMQYRNSELAKIA